MAMSRGIRAAREELVRRGVLVDSGQRARNPRTGELEMCWRLNPALSKEEMDRQRGVKPPRGEAIAVEADATPFMSELVLLVCAGAVLFGAGLLVELAT